MSRSRPTNTSNNPAVRWFEWKGETGGIRYYDKEAEKNVDVPLPFTALLLDQLGTVKGWHDASDSGIYANEVRDTRQQPLVVKSFKGGVLAEGLYAAIKDRVHTFGGYFVANCYIAAKIDGVLQIASLRWKGAALSAWMEFTKANRKALDDKAFAVTGFTEGQKGRVKFAVPTFAIKDITPETQAAALALDEALQAHLDVYLTTTPTRQQVEQHDHEPVAVPQESAQPSTITDDDIPF